MTSKETEFKNDPKNHYHYKHRDIELGGGKLPMSGQPSTPNS